MYLPVVVDLLLKSSVNNDGVKIHFTQVIAELEKDVMFWNSEIGTSSSSHFLCGTFSSIISIFFQVIILNLFQIIFNLIILSH